ncbi:hypothetical protein CB1_000486001 [Camelus ferus]|nr:hypothetical protein CB1_000486001 [Camelus ferus]
MEPLWGLVGLSGDQQAQTDPAGGSGRCINVALMKPHCGQVPCGPKICIQPSRERFPIKNFCSRCQHPLSMCPRLPSRMLPLIHPPAPSYPIVLRK